MEKEEIIEVNNITKDYGKGRGIFGISFKVKKGEVFGYCGTNGSGKTTTIRILMGFVKADSGEAKIKGLDVWKDSEEVKKYIGYIPGEINFPDVYSGTDFLKIQASMINLSDFALAEKVINAMQLDPTANLKRMSKGMKQKTAIVNSMMNLPEILIFDEPTTGLDPLMRQAFINLINEAKAQGKTIFMSSHMFDEMEDTCDSVGLIYNGKLIDIIKIEDLKNWPIKKYELEFANKVEYKKFLLEKIKIIDKNEKENMITTEIPSKNICQFMKMINKYDLKSIVEIKYTLENYFLEAVGGNKDGTSTSK